MSQKFPIYCTLTLSLIFASLCYTTTSVKADEDNDPPATVEEQEEESTSEAEIESKEEPRVFQLEIKNEGDRNIRPDSMAYHNFVTFIYNDFDYLLRCDPRLISACSEEGQWIDVKQKVNEYFTNEEDLNEMGKTVFDRIVGFEREVPYGCSYGDNYSLPVIDLRDANKNVLYDEVNFWSGNLFKGYREEYMKPYSVGEFRFTEKFRAQVRERKGNMIRGWTKKMSLADLSLCAASTPIAVFMDTDEKRIRERNAWMPTPLEDFMYYSSRHQFPYVGFLDYSLKYQNENGELIEIDSTTKLPAQGGKLICSWDKLTLFEMDDIIKAHRN